MSETMYADVIQTGECDFEVTTLSGEMLFCCCTSDEAESCRNTVNTAYLAGKAGGEAKWRPKSELPKTVEDGSRFVVAVEVVDEKYGQNYWDIAIVCVKCDEHYFSVESDGDIWGWSWDDIEWWMPINDITAGLPTLSRSGGRG